MTITIYHNPACGTSRNVLALIRNSGEAPRIIEYLQTPPSRAELVDLIAPSTRRTRGTRTATPVARASVSARAPFSSGRSSTGAPCTEGRAHINLAVTLIPAAFPTSPCLAWADRRAGLPGQGTEYHLELTYQTQVTPWMVIQPDIQGIVSPSGGVRDSKGERVRDEATFGLHGNVTF